MSKFRCLCGFIIRDQTNDLPYKAEYFADEDYESSYGTFVDFIAEILQKASQGERRALLLSYFGENYPQDLSVHDIVSDALTSIRVAFGHTIYECEQCGRLWLQPDSNSTEMVPYMPETETRGLLKSRKKKEP